MGTHRAPGDVKAKPGLKHEGHLKSGGLRVSFFPIPKRSGNLSIPGRSGYGQERLCRERRGPARRLKKESWN